MAARKNTVKALNVPGALSLGEAVNHVLDGIRKLEGERDSANAKMVAMKNDHYLAYQEVQRERNELRKELADAKQRLEAKGPCGKCIASLPCVCGKPAYVPGREIVIGGSDDGHAKLVLENKELRESNEELAGKLENLETDKAELERLTEREKELEAKVESAETGEKDAEEARDEAVESSEALKVDMIEVARWIFGLGGTFVDLSALLSADSQALLQLAYLGGDQDMLDTASVGTIAGSCLFTRSG